MNGFLGIIRRSQDVVGLWRSGRLERHPTSSLVVGRERRRPGPPALHVPDGSRGADERRRGDHPGLTKLPSEYIKSNVYATFQDDETHTPSRFPYDHLLWASDFPHTDSTWRSPGALIEGAGRAPHREQKQAIFRDNTAVSSTSPRRAFLAMEDAVAVA